MYDFSEDPAGEYVWLSAAREYTEKYPLSLSQVPLETSDDVLTIAKTICNQFKTLVEDNGLSKLLYNSNGTPKHESAAQLLFYGIADSYCDAKQVNLPDYDVIFVDECSTIDNRTMGRFLSKMSPDTFLVLAGDIHQIESIEFGNWFFYAKDIIKTPGANVELLSTWRTQDQALISLWNEVRTRADMITEKLVINGPYSEDIGPNVFKRECEDEVILCLNYDGKFGLNNMNNYFQAANTKGEAIPWAEWSYKVGDPILFNDSKRFDLLYNNLKGRIVDIEKHSGSISFTVDVEIPLTELICKRDGIEFIESIENGTRIRFAVYEYDESKKGEDLDENLRLKSVVPFQLAYAVSIHKAQGLEYDSVKVIIPSNNAEKITHGIFYTAITRAKTNLKIYWSSESMHDVVKGFATDESKRKSLEIVKTKLGKN